MFRSSVRLTRDLTPHPPLPSRPLAARMDLGTITERMAVRNAVQSGNVEDAIDRVNDLNPEVGLPRQPGSMQL